MYASIIRMVQLIGAAGPQREETLLSMIRIEIHSQIRWDMR